MPRVIVASASKTDEQRPRSGDQSAHVIYARQPAVRATPCAHEPRRAHRRVAKQRVVAWANRIAHAQERARVARAEREEIHDFDPAETPCPRQPDARANGRVVAPRVGGAGIEHDESCTSERRIPGAPQQISIPPRAVEDGAAEAVLASDELSRALRGEAGRAMYWPAGLRPNSYEPRISGARVHSRSKVMALSRGFARVDFDRRASCAHERWRYPYARAGCPHAWPRRCAAGRLQQFQYRSSRKPCASTRSVFAAMSPVSIFTTQPAETFAMKPGRESP